MVGCRSGHGEGGGLYEPYLREEFVLQTPQRASAGVQERK